MEQSKMILCMTPNRVQSWSSIAVAGLLLNPLAAKAEKTQDKRPNIIVILSDDMGYSDVGCFGSEIRTPNIDRLAKNGVSFTHFYNCARSSPSRASLMTGLYPHQAGIGLLGTAPIEFEEPGYKDDLSHNAATLPEVLKQAGYATYMTGKWHISKAMSATGDKSNWPCQRGFDRYFGTLNGSGSYYDPATLISNNTFITHEKDFYYTNAISDSTVKFIKENPKEKPFFFYVSYTCAHWPLQAPEKEIAKYKKMYDKGWDSVRLNRFNKLRKLRIISDDCILTEKTVSVPDWEGEPLKEWQARRMEVYAAMIDIMDQGIGKIITALEEKGELENTVIFYMQDNGGCAELQKTDKPALPLTDEQKVLKPTPFDVIAPAKRTEYTRDGRYIRTGRGVMPGDADTWVSYGEAWANVSNTPYKMYKQWVHEGGISSPLIVQWPSGISAKGALNRQAFHLIDIMPTILELSGAKYPDHFNGKEILPFEGKSLVPAFENKPIERDFLIWEHCGNRAIRMGKWKLVSMVKKQMIFTPADENAWELYDIEKDPSESKNLAAKYPGKVKEMAERWEKEAYRTLVKPWPWEKNTRSLSY